MPSGRKKIPRPKSGSRGPSGFTVFIVFLLLGVVCVTAGFALGRYLLATFGDTLADTGGSLIVIANGLRLLRHGRPPRSRGSETGPAVNHGGLPSRRRRVDPAATPASACTREGCACSLAVDDRDDGEARH